MESLTLSIFYTWKIILNILSSSRVAKYFRSGKIRLMLEDCPRTESMTLPTMVSPPTLALYNPKSVFRCISVMQLGNQVEDLIFHLTLHASLVPWCTLSGGCWQSVPAHTLTCMV